MRQTMVAGAALAVVAALLIALGGGASYDIERVAVLGLALGAVLGLVADRTPVERAIGFGIGFALSWVAYLLRASVLPDSTSGRAVAALLLVLVLTAVAVASRGRYPLWTLALGAGALAGAYEVTFLAMPSLVIDESPVAATSVLLAAGIGFAVASLASALVPAGASPPPRHTGRVADLNDGEPADMDELLTRGTKE